MAIQSDTKDFFKKHANESDSFIENAGKDPGSLWKDVGQVAKPILAGAGSYAAYKASQRAYTKYNEGSGVIGRAVKKVQKVGAKIKETTKERKTRKAAALAKKRSETLQLGSGSGHNKTVQDILTKQHNERVAANARKPKIDRSKIIDVTPVKKTKPIIMDMGQKNRGRLAFEKHGKKRTPLGNIPKTTKVTRVDLGKTKSSKGFPSVKGKGRGKVSASTTYTQPSKVTYAYDTAGKGRQQFTPLTSKSSLGRRAKKQTKIIEQATPGGAQQGLAQKRLNEIRQQQSLRNITKGEAFGSRGRHYQGHPEDKRFKDKPRYTKQKKTSTHIKPITTLYQGPTELAELSSGKGNIQAPVRQGYIKPKVNRGVSKVTTKTNLHKPIQAKSGNKIKPVQSTKQVARSNWWNTRGKQTVVGLAGKRGKVLKGLIK